MGGETDLQQLLSSLSAVLDPQTYVFVTMRGPAPEGLAPKMVFEEVEGTTLICTLQQARAHGLDWEYQSKMITLNIHSSLEAVGFMAVIATALAAQGLSVNPVSGFYHDHIFVPVDRAGDAMRILAEIAAKASA